MDTSSGAHAQAAAEAAIAAASAVNKPKRVRTGCLTCRERHLKCDEGMPTCMNCRKSMRECKRGIRLNFIDTTCKRPPTIPMSSDWRINFLDESRDIAREYIDGEEQYSRKDAHIMDVDHSMNAFGYQPAQSNPPMMAQQSMPNMQALHGGDHPVSGQNVNMFAHQEQQQAQQHAHQQAQQHAQQQAHQQQQQAHQQQQQAQGMNSGASAFSHASLPSHHSHHSSQHPSPYHQQIRDVKTEPEYQAEAKEILNTQEETLYMQVFVEEVGLWMDSMDSMKHFSRILPFHALSQPMLLNAFLACGVRHLTLVNPAVYQEEKALSYYDTASRYLLRALENPERDSVICATTAVILNVYEIMTEKAMMRMNHIAGARALIKECGWDARSTGIGAACFWVNVGMELLSNLHFNWQASWNPDTWGLTLDLSMETLPGREEIWTHRILYITAKIGDFRATVPRSQEANSREETRRRQKRFEEWNYLKSLADTWNSNIPRTMHPAAHLLPYQTRSRSAFPEIWLIKRTTIIARLFYHTAMVLLAQINPIMTKEAPEMHELEQHHAHQICGIAAHVKDRGVASVALRSLHHAAECLEVRREQEEALSIFIRIHKETGWRIGFIPKDLMEKWGWDPNTDVSTPLPTTEDPSNHYLNKQFTNGGMTGHNKYSDQLFDQYEEHKRQQQEARQQAQAMAESHSRRQSHLSPPSANGHAQQKPSPQPKRPPPGIVNPMFGNADFTAAKHPYSEHYVAPSMQPQGQMGFGLALAGMGPFGAPQPQNNGGYGF